MSTTVTLSGVWVNLASDLTQSVRLDTHDVKAEQLGSATVDKYAAGNFRSSSSPGVQWVVTVSFRFPARDDVATLRDWIDKKVLYRDLFGRKFHAVYSSVGELEVLELADTSKLSPSLTFTQVTSLQAV